MTKLPAYAIHNGEATGEMLRLVANAVSSGARGIARPADFKVTASTAGNVKVAPGGALLPTRYASSPQFQTYAVGMTSEATLPIPPTGSGSGATRYVIARIEDPQYGGQNTGAPNWDLTVVASITNLPYPFVELAKIVMPASTSVITSAMITDIRNIALPRSERHVVVVPNTDLDRIQTTTYQNFATGYTMTTIPDWATRLIVRADLLGVINEDADIGGFLVVKFGATDIETRRFVIKHAGVGDERHDISLIGEVNIASAAGTSGALQVRGRRTEGTGKLYADGYTTCAFEYEFIEGPA